MRLIDADALIEKAHHEEKGMSEPFNEQFGILVEWLVDKTPTIEPERKWIPVSERLPEKPNMYTVTDSKGDVVRFVFNDTESCREYWLRCAKAWMPLPEPYREEVIRMKDKAMMMFDHIRSSVDVDPWAIAELKKVLDAYLADGCSGCAYESVNEWELPCCKCKRNRRDYWRKGVERREE